MHKFFKYTKKILMNKPEIIIPKNNSTEVDCVSYNPASPFTFSHGMDFFLFVPFLLTLDLLLGCQSRLPKIERFLLLECHVFELLQQQFQMLPRVLFVHFWVF